MTDARPAGAPIVHYLSAMGTARHATSFDKWRAALLALAVHAIALTAASLAWSLPGSLQAPSNRSAMQATLVISETPEPADASAADDPVASPQVGSLPTPIAPSAEDAKDLPASPAIDHPKAKLAEQPHPDQTASAHPAALAKPTAALPVGLNNAAPQPVESPIEDFEAPTNINELRGWYARQIHRAAYANWTPTGVPQKIHCHVVATQDIGGRVTNVDYDDCPFDPAARDTVDHALHAAPLPYEGFEVVFMRKVAIDFCQPEADCLR
jgi:hypothetical protein